MGKRENIQREIALQAYRKGLAGQTLQTLLGSAAVMGSMDFGEVSKRWEQTFAQPAMEAWWKYNAPGIRDEFAGIPGAFYSSDRARGVVGEAQKFFGTSIVPTLFSALEGAAGRVPSMLSAISSIAYGSPIQEYTERKKEEEIAPWAGGTIGSLIGGAYGGPAGGMAGGQLGSMIGGMFG